MSWLSGLGIISFLIFGAVIWFGLQDLPFIVKMGVTAPCIGAILLIMLFGENWDC